MVGCDAQTLTTIDFWEKKEKEKTASLLRSHLLHFVWVHRLVTVSDKSQGVRREQNSENADLTILMPEF